jgi:hypothetical protein
MLKTIRVAPRIIGDLEGVVGAVGKIGAASSILFKLVDYKRTWSTLTFQEANEATDGSHRRGDRHKGAEAAAGWGIRQGGEKSLPP